LHNIEFQMTKIYFELVRVKSINSSRVLALSRKVPSIANDVVRQFNF